MEPMATRIPAFFAQFLTAEDAESAELFTESLFNILSADSAHCAVEGFAT